HDLGDKTGLAGSLEGMGNNAREMGHYEEARRYLREALQYASDPMVSVTPSIYIGIGELFLQMGRRARAMELLALALHHPLGDHQTKERAQRLLIRFHAEAAQQSSPEADYEAVTTALLDELQNSEAAPLTRHSPQAGEALIEPLSEREL